MKIYALLFALILFNNLLTAQTHSLTDIAGKWFIHYTNFPMWLKGDKTQPTFSYTIKTKGTTVGLSDHVEYLKKGQLKSILGFDTPTDTTNLRFVWRGKGLLFLLKSHWQIMYLDPSHNWAIIQFEKTLFTPKGFDVIVRTPTLDNETRRIIEENLRNLGLKTVLTQL